MEIRPVPKPPAGAKAEFPSAPLCYVAGANGLFKRVQNDFYTACVKLEGIPSLAELKEEAHLHVPPLPRHLFRQVEAFFVEVYRRHESEAIVLLFCNPKTQTWQVVTPPQKVRGLHVEYDLNMIHRPPSGFELFGTIHSHADIKAFHSGTDDADECFFDGIHITVGHVNRPVRSYACRWMLAGKAFKVELADVLEVEVLPETDAAWLAQVQPAPAVERMPFWIKENAIPFDLFGESVLDHEAYLQQLEFMRDEIEERLLEAEQLELEGGPHGTKP